VQSRDFGDVYDCLMKYTHLIQDKLVPMGAIEMREEDTDE
jgi:hypothetical protein